MRSKRATANSKRSWRGSDHLPRLRLAVPVSLPDLMRRLDRKLDIQRGMSLTYDDLALLVATGAYAVLKQAAEDEERAGDFPALYFGGQRSHTFIYFIQAGDHGPIKIGFARDIQNRRTALQSSCHEQLHIRAWINAPQCNERTIHCHFQPEHVRGEWFRPSPRLLAYIETLR